MSARRGVREVPKTYYSYVEVHPAYRNEAPASL